MSQKSVVLLSGGLDSLTCFAYAKDKGHDIYALSFDYGQRHRAELEAAKTIARQLGAKEHRIFKFDFDGIGGSALTDMNLDVPTGKLSEGIPITYVPARNTIFLAAALGYAEVIEARSIYMGASAVDYSGYPDCRPDYFKAFQHLADLATRSAIENKAIQICTPLMDLSKAQTILLGLSLGVDYSLSVSCYQANEKGEACGKCDSCLLRKRGFAEALVADPTRYIPK